MEREGEMETIDPTLRRALAALRAVCQVSPESTGTCPTDRIDADPETGLRRAFVAWFDARVQLDTKAVALRTLPRWSATLTSLYGNFCAWMFDRQQVPSTAAQFRNLLLELCCELRTFDEEEFVLNLALREDVQAVERFETGKR